MGYRHCFGRFEVLPTERQLLAEGRPVALGARAFDMLLALIERRERLVTKAELLDVVWPGLVVEEGNLPVQVSALRKALGPQAIATIPGRGYRFAMALDDAAPAAPQPSRAVATALAQAPPLIGRNTDLAALDALLRAQRLVSLVGPGGVGKSLLARALLQRHRAGFEHGVAWVDLAGLAQSSRVVGSICAALGLNLGAAEPLKALVGALQPLRLLIALDNAEQVADEVARVAQALHEQAPGVHLLVTSQVPLKIAAEQVYRLAPLALPGADDAIDVALQQGALALLVERARAADARFTLGPGQLAAAVEICRRLDGLPLAIELAAARLPQLGVAGLAAAIEARFDALDHGRRGVAPRHQTLRAALHWSVSLLSDDERSVFARLGVFASGFSLEMAQAVVADAALDRWAVLDLLAALIDRSLVAVDGLDAPRYRLLETARAYALECLAATPAGDDMRARHAGAYRRYFAQACDLSANADASRDAWREALLPDADNARSACAWAREHDPETAVALATSLASVLGSQLPLERAALLESVRPLLGAGVAPPVQAQWYLEASLERAGAQPALALAHAQQAAELFRGLGDRLGLYRALCVQLYCEPAQSAPPDATQQALMSELLALEDPHWSSAVRAEGANGAACWYSARGQFDTAIEWRRRNLALQRQAGSSWLGIVAHSNLLDSLLAAGRVDEAIATGTALLTQLQGTRQLAVLPAIRLNLAAAHLSTGDTPAARELAQASLPQALRLGWQPYWADVLALLAALERRPRAAALLLGYADAAYAAIATAREVNEARAVERAAALCRASLGEAAFAQRLREGARLSDADIAPLAFATDDAV